MTQDDIAALRSLVGAGEKATPGEWETDIFQIGYHSGGPYQLVWSGRKTIARTELSTANGSIGEADAAFIALSKNSLPALSAALERMERLEALLPFARLGVAVMDGWPDTFGAIGGFELEEAAVKVGVLLPVPGGFDPDKHHDSASCAEPGDPWFFMAPTPGLSTLEGK